MNPKVDDFLNKASRWQEELNLLRSIILASGLKEDFKWMHPCYTFNSKNIILIHGFKNYCAILFHNGSLLKDPKKILIQQTKNVQYGRQVRFTNISEIQELELTIKSYIFEAIEVEKSGFKIEKKKTSDYKIPTELELKFNDSFEFKEAFKKLTPGRQKGYLLYFSNPKQTKTRINRIEKLMSRIINGYGLNDCTCGQSKRMPNCDGSHKNIQ